MAAIHILGSPTSGQKLFHYRSPLNGRRLSFQAESGFVTVIAEEKDGSESYTRVPRAEFTARAYAISQMAKKAKYPRERKAHDDLALCMVQACRAAREQGDPLESPTVARQVAAGRRRVSSRGHNFETHVPAIPRARPDAPFKDLGGTTVIDPRKVLIVPC